jgi:two-component system response regulator PilR (NtrC family)
MSRILVVDDELSLREMLEIFLTKEGHEVLTAADGAKAIAILTEEDNIDLVVTDLRMPGAHGMVVLDRCRELHPNTPVVVMTAFASHQTATEAMKMGAYDYFSKPFELDEINQTVERALERRRLVVESRRLKETLQSESALRAIVGNSRAIQQVFDIVRRVAKTRTNVLVLGESGTGKELIARALHDQSERRGGPFVVINCGAVPENLLESEFFGHKRGSFTGANADKDGPLQGRERGARSSSTRWANCRCQHAGQAAAGAAGTTRQTRRETCGRSPSTSGVISATNRNLETEVKRRDDFARISTIAST